MLKSVMATALLRLRLLRLATALLSSLEVLVETPGYNEENPSVTSRRGLGGQFLLACAPQLSLLTQPVPCLKSA
jgi:hypothetical protein